VDVDGDGRLDLLSGSNCCDSLGFHLFRRTADGSWAPRQRREVRFPGGDDLAFHESFVTAADWDGDGVPDLLYAWDGIRVAPGPFPADGPSALTRGIDLTPHGSG